MWCLRRDDHSAWKHLYFCQPNAGRVTVVKAERRGFCSAGNNTQHWLAEGTAPRAHSIHVATAWLRVAVRMRVEETDDIATALLAIQNGLGVKGDGGRCTG